MRHRIQLPCLLLAAAVLLMLAACSGDSGPSSPGGSTLVLTRATVSVNGQVVNGLTLPRGHGQGGTARFEAVLEENGVRRTGGSVVVQHDSPGGMMMGAREFHLYDDGTHGDHTPGDGLYCFEDTQGQYGCHTNQAAMGQHHYDFHGRNGQGQQSNRMRVTVTIRE